MTAKLTYRTIKDKQDTSGYNDLYIATLRIGRTTIRTYRAMGFLRDAERWVCAEAVRRGLLTDAQAWEVYTNGQTDGRGTAIARGCDERPANYAL